MFNTARVKPGSTVAVIGCGGVGLNCVQGAVIAGALRVIGIDRFETKLAKGHKWRIRSTSASGGKSVRASSGLTRRAFSPRPVPAVPRVPRLSNRG